jgi:hypothetical protein
MPDWEYTGPLYNTRDLVEPPGTVAGLGPFADVLRGQRELSTPLGLPVELQEGAPLPAELAPPYEGASRLLTWRTRIIVSGGEDQRHALSNKVECTLVLRDLAREVGLSKAGLAWIKALCGARRVVALM